MLMVHSLRGHAFFGGGLVLLRAGELRVAKCSACLQEGVITRATMQGYG